MIICTKEVSVGARKNAYTLLVEIGNAFIRFCGNTKGDTPVVLLLSMQRLESLENAKIITVFKVRHILAITLFATWCFYFHNQSYEPQIFFLYEMSYLFVSWHWNWQALNIPDQNMKSNLIWTAAKIRLLNSWYLESAWIVLFKNYMNLS